MFLIYHKNIIYTNTENNNINKDNINKDIINENNIDNNNNDNIIIHIHTICHNDRDIMPYIIKYWRLYGDHVYVYLMSSSNDGSREYLQQFPDFISIIEIEDNNNKCNLRNQIIKNERWKESRNIADFVIVTDFDEVIYAKNLKQKLAYMKKNNMTIVKPEIYELITANNVLDENVLDENKLIHEQITSAFYYPKFGKHCLFNPNLINEINYKPGSHVCKPIGKVKYYDNKNIYLIHIKYLGLNRFINNCNYQKNRLSEENKKKKLSKQYYKSIKELSEDFDFKLKRSVNILNIIK